MPQKIMKFWRPGAAAFSRAGEARLRVFRAGYSRVGQSCLIAEPCQAAWFRTKMPITESVWL